MASAPRPLTGPPKRGIAVIPGVPTGFLPSGLRYSPPRNQPQGPNNDIIAGKGVFYPPKKNQPQGPNNDIIAGKGVQLTAAQKAARRIINNPRPAPVVAGGTPTAKPTAAVPKPSSNSGSAGIATPNTAPGASKDSLMKQAQQQVAATMDPQIADYTQQIKDAMGLGARQTGDLQDLYRRLGLSIGADQAQGDIAGANTQSSINDRYGQLQQSLGQIFGNANAGTNAELNRMGLSAVSPAATAGATNDQNYLSRLSAIDQANAVSNSQSKTQGFDQLVNVLSGQAGLAGAQKQAAVAQTLAQTVADLRSKRGALSAQKANAVETLFNQLNTAQTKAQADAAQQQFMNSIAAGKLGVSQQQANTSATKVASDVAKNTASIAATKSGNAASDALKQAQAAAAWHQAYAPYPTSKAGTAKGYTAGLNYLSGIKNDQWSKKNVDDAKNLYIYYVTNYGPTAGTQLAKEVASRGGKGGPVYQSLPTELKTALMDAMTIGATK